MWYGAARRSKGEAMVAARRIALSVASDQRQTLVEISRSRTEPANRVERARIILAYLDEPSAHGVAQRAGLTRQKVKRCLERAAELGVVLMIPPTLLARADEVIE
jgi:DNA-directed RNA polymerase specialized sigma subunit